MDESMVTVASFGTPIDAHVARGRLEDNGIDAYVADENMVGVAWHLGLAVGGVKLQVAAEDAERAREILASPSALEDETGDAEEKAPPPGGEDLSRRALVAAFWGILVPPLQFYSLWLVGRFMLSRGRQPQSGTGSIVLALVLDVWVFVLLKFLFAALVNRM